MSKHTHLKAPKTRPNAAKPADPSMFDRVETMLTTLLASVEATVAAGEASPALVREANGIARAMVTLEAERRARAKQEAAAREWLSLPVVLQFLRSLPAAERGRVIRELTHMQTDGRSGLA
jgi:hypothetical protein